MYILAGGRQSHGDGGHEVRQFPAGGDADGARVPHKFPGDHEIDHGIELLNDVGQDDGKGKGQEHLPYHALS